MYTATVRLPLVFLTDPADPGGAMLECGTRRTQPQARVLDGEFRAFAGGVVRVVSRTLRTKQTPIQLVMLTSAGVAQLDVWAGKLLLLRTTEGQRIFGSYLSADLTVVQRSTGVEGFHYDAAFVFTEVTYQEGLVIAPTPTPVPTPTVEPVYERE